MMLKGMIQKKSHTIGLPPGTYIHLGEKKEKELKVSVIDYDMENLNVRELVSVEEAFPFKDSPTVSWLNLAGLHDVESLQKIGKHFGIHPLVMEDVLNTGHQPKSEIYDDHVFFIIKMITFNENDRSLEYEQVSLILGENFVISFQEKAGDVFNPVRKRIETTKGRLRKQGADYLLYALLDVVVDNYYLILEKLAGEIEDLEGRALSDPEKKLVQDIQRLKSEIVLLRKSVWPLRDAIDDLMGDDTQLFTPFTMPYLHDLYDHTIHVIDTIETFRDMIAGLMDVYLSSLSIRMNDIMKVLTIIATIFIPLTFIAGIYGMNFENIPELKWEFGYHFIWLIMLGVGGSLLLYFKKKNWI